MSEQRIVTCIGTVALWEVSRPLLPNFPTAVSQENAKNQTGVSFAYILIMQILRQPLRWDGPDTEGTYWRRINC